MDKNNISVVKTNVAVKSKISPWKKLNQNPLRKKPKNGDGQMSLLTMSTPSKEDMMHIKIESINEEENTNSLHNISHLFEHSANETIHPDIDPSITSSAMTPCDNAGSRHIKLEPTYFDNSYMQNEESLRAQISVQYEVESVHIKSELTVTEQVSKYRINEEFNEKDLSTSTKSLENLQDVETFLVKCEPIEYCQDADRMVAIEADGKLEASTSIRVKKEHPTKKTSKTKGKCVSLVNQIQPSNQYECAVCCKNFIRKIKLIEHLHVHGSNATGDSRHLKCQTCGKVVLKKRIKEHIKTHSKEKPFQCTMCEKLFKYKHSLTAHSKVCTGKKEIVKKEWLCTVCGMTLPTKHQLRNHRQCHKDMILKCDRCKKTFMNSDLLTQHIRIHHMGEKPFKCTECDSSFKTKTHLLRHMNRHKRFPKEFECAACSKTFSTFSNLKIHITMIHVKPEQVEKPFQCALCPKRFLLRTGLTVHMRSHTGEKPYKCSLCEKRYSTSSSLKVHFTIHTGDRPFECDLCGNKFSLKRNLKMHIFRHAGRKSYKCLMCFKKYECSSTLKRHIMGHTGERPFECIICQRTYVTSTQLKLHMRKHTGEKPFECTQCGKSYRVRVNLDRHIRAHTGEKLFECSICNKRFVDKAGVRNHQIVHTGIKRFECNFCKKKFYTKTALRRHSTRTTGECGRIKRRLGHM